MDNEADKSSETGQGSKAEPSESLVRQLDAGLTELIKSQQQATAELKAGTKRGVSREIGKLTLVDSAQDKAGPPPQVEEYGGPKDKLALTGGDKTAEDKTAAASWNTNYAGEDIKHSLKPLTHTVKGGETLESMARDHLGTATPEEVRLHVLEIARLNGLDPKHPGDISGLKLNIPGHTSDGALITEDPDGRERTVWKDGKILVIGEDSGYQRTPTKDGGYTEAHWGPRKQDNFWLTKTPEGKLLVAEQGGDKPYAPMEGYFLQTERNRLNELAEAKIQDPDKLAKFRADMARFEHRAEEQGLGPDQVASTYKELSKLLESDGTKPTSRDQRAAIAEQVIAQAASPSSVDQGNHNTCNVTVVEARTYTKYPAAAAKLVADVAISGEYYAPDGTHVQLDPSTLQPDKEAKGDVDHGGRIKDGKRSFASQIFQVTAVNLALEQDNQKHDPPACLKYLQLKPGDIDPTTGKDYAVGKKPHDTGERLINFATKPPMLLADSPGLNDDQIVGASNIITGQNEKDVMIEHKKLLTTKSETGTISDGSAVTLIATENQLNDKLAELKKNGKLPIIIGVHTDNEPFFTDGGGNTAGGSGGGHVVCITDYDEHYPPKVSIDNQWGSKADHFGKKEITVHDLYLATCKPDDPGTLAELENTVKWNRDHNQIETSKELQLLRLQQNEEVNLLGANVKKKDMPGMYDVSMVAKVIEAEKRWEEQEKNGDFNQQEHDAACKYLKYMIKELDPSRRIAIVELLEAKLPGNSDISNLAQELDVESLKKAQAKQQALSAATVSGMTNAASNLLPFGD